MIHVEPHFPERRVFRQENPGVAVLLVDLADRETLVQQLGPLKDVSEIKDEELYLRHILSRSTAMTENETLIYDWLSHLSSEFQSNHWNKQIPLFEKATEKLNFSQAFALTVTAYRHAILRRQSNAIIAFGALIEQIVQRNLRQYQTFELTDLSLNSVSLKPDPSNMPEAFFTELREQKSTLITQNIIHRIGRIGIPLIGCTVLIGGVAYAALKHFSILKPAVPQVEESLSETWIGEISKNFTVVASVVAVAFCVLVQLGPKNRREIREYRPPLPLEPLPRRQGVPFNSLETQEVQASIALPSAARPITTQPPQRESLNTLETQEVQEPIDLPSASKPITTQEQQTLQDLDNQPPRLPPLTPRKEPLVNRRAYHHSEPKIERQHLSYAGYTEEEKKILRIVDEADRQPLKPKPREKPPEKEEKKAPFPKKDDKARVDGGKEIKKTEPKPVLTNTPDKSFLVNICQAGKRKEYVYADGDVKKLDTSFNYEAENLEPGFFEQKDEGITLLSSSFDKILFTFCTLKDSNHLIINVVDNDKYHVSMIALNKMTEDNMIKNLKNIRLSITGIKIPLQTPLGTKE